MLLITHGNNGILFNFFYHYFIIIIFFMYVVACLLLKKIYNNNKIIVIKIKIKKIKIIKNNVPMTHGNNGFIFNFFTIILLLLYFLCIW